MALAKLDEMETLSTQGEQDLPSPAVPTGQGPHVDALVHATPAKHVHVRPHPAATGGGGGGDIGAGGAGMTSTTGGLLSAALVTATPTRCSAAADGPPVLRNLFVTAAAAVELSVKT